DGLGVADVVDAFIDRDARAEREDHQRDDEAPEIQLAAMAERVLGVRWALGAMQPVQQQDLVAAIHQGMDGFRQHGRAAGDYRGRGLGGCYEEVAGESGVEDAFGIHVPTTPQSGTDAPQPFCPIEIRTRTARDPAAHLARHGHRSVLLDLAAQDTRAARPRKKGSPHSSVPSDVTRITGSSASNQSMPRCCTRSRTTIVSAEWRITTWCVSACAIDTHSPTKAAAWSADGRRLGNSRGMNLAGRGVVRSSESWRRKSRDSGEAPSSRSHRSSARPASANSRLSRDMRVTVANASAGIGTAYPTRAVSES